MHKAQTEKRDPAHNVPALVRLCQTRNARGIGVLLLRLPHLEVWRKDVNPEWNRQIQSAVKAVQAQVGDGVWFYDLAETPGFDLWLFTDGLHFHDAGCQRLAELLNPLISDSCRWADPHWPSK